MDAIFQNIWEATLFMIPVILLLAFCSKRLGKRYGVRWRYLVWLVVAVRLCIPVQLTLPESMMGMRVELPAITSQKGNDPVQPVGNDPAGMTAPALTTEEMLTGVQETKALAEEIWKEDSAGVKYMYHIDLPILVDFFRGHPDVLWMAGVVLFLLWQDRKYASFKRMLKRNRRKVQDAEVEDTYLTLCKEMDIKKCPEIYFCEPLPSPLCVGFFHPTIYINSEEREKKDLYLILKHELIHCKRKDLWFKGVLMLARALHFFNPFVHWMAHLAEKDMELSCDVAVMENCDMAEREHYSMAILRTVKEANHKNMRMSTAFSGGKEELQHRFETIFDMTAKKRGVALFMAAVLVVCGGTAFVGCTAREPAKEETVSGVVYGDYTEQLVKDLYAAKLQYIGNHVGVGKILGLLPLPDGVTYHDEGMELKTDEGEPMGVTRHLNWEATEETTYHYNNGSMEGDDGFMDARWSAIHGMIFLALVDNADFMKYDFHDNAGKVKDGGVMIEIGSEREAIEKRYFGGKDLRDFAKDEETFRDFVLAINRYFYEGIETDRQKYVLTRLDDAAAKRRMDQMLYGSAPPVMNTSDRSISYQMVLADTLLFEIAGQKLTSSNPVDYIKCDQYQELVNIGEPALYEFLATFAEGDAGEGLESYIMMFACQDILGEERSTEFSPAEWYRMYNAVTSTYLADFYADKRVYTEELEQKYAIGTPDLRDCSIVAASRDQRVKAVYDALAQKNSDKKKTFDEKVTFYAPYIYKIDEKGDTMTVFTTIYESTYVRVRMQQGYGLFDRSGSITPTRLDFEKKKDKWVLVDQIKAMDGSYYSDSIETMCQGYPGMEQKMLDGGNVQELMWQNIIYYMNGHYEGMKLPIYETSYIDPKMLKTVNKYIEVIPIS